MCPGGAWRVRRATGENAKRSRIAVRFRCLAGVDSPEARDREGEGLRARKLDVDFHCDLMLGLEW